MTDTPKDRRGLRLVKEEETIEEYIARLRKQGIEIKNHAYGISISGPVVSDDEEEE